jgi:hypothetical protein
MIKALIMVIRTAVTWDVTILPLKRNLIPRFTMERAWETMKDALTPEKGGYWDRWKEDNLSVIYATFTSVRGWHSTS